MLETILPNPRPGFHTIYGTLNNKRVKEVTFIVTHECNLRCTYCYEHHKGGGKMSLETGKKIIDLLFEEDSKNNRYINEEKADAIVLDFIGGEPFLEIDLISDIVDYFREKAFSLNHRWATNYMISITSNGLNYFDSKVQEFLRNNRKKVSCTITVDGNKELHDKCRLTKDGKGSYDMAAAAARDIADKYGQIGTKMTFSKENLNYCADATIDIINNLKETVINANCAFEPEWNLDDAKLFYSELKRVADYLIDNNLYDKIYFSPLNRLAGDKRDFIDQNWCGGTGAMLAFDINGDIYPCLRYAPLSIGDKQPKLLLGNLEEGLLHSEQFIKNADMLDAITKTSQSEQKCIDCPIETGCAWCSAYNYEVYGTPNKRVTNICVMHQARVLVRNYYINKICNILNCPKEKMEVLIPKEWALQIISEQEFDMICNL